jgi:hypothetical protein
MKRIQHITALALTSIMGLSTLSLPLVARASETGKRNTALGIGAAAIALLLTQKNKLPGLLTAGGAAYAYSQYNNDVQARHRREQYGYDANSQNNGYRYGQNGFQGSYNQSSCPQNNGYRFGQDNTDSGYNQDSRQRYPQDDSQTYHSQNYGDNGSPNYGSNSGDNRGAIRRTASRTARTTR